MRFFKILVILLLAWSVNAFAVTIEKKFILVDKETGESIPNVEIVHKSSYNVGYTDNTGKSTLTITSENAEEEIFFRKKCYFETSKTLELFGTNKPITVKLEPSCFPENTIGVLICDFVDAMDSVNQQTANWAEKLNKISHII
jgi:hypothetical protein